MASDQDNWSPTSTSSQSSNELSDFSISDENSTKEENVRICQYVHRVIDYSSQYGSDTSISYTAFNIVGRQSQYPDYGDFPETFAMVNIPINIDFWINLQLVWLPANLRTLVGDLTRSPEGNNGPKFA